MKPITAELLTIGDEILYGQITDTNSQWMGNELAAAGIRVIRKTSVGDVESEILTAFAEAKSRADVVLITGGLGPTSDDLTKPCLVKFFNTSLEIHQEALAEVTAFFVQRGRELTELNRLQAALPVNCEKITNVAGTAPGMWFDVDGVVFVSMPGVPHEMKTMMRDQVIPRLRKRFELPVILHRIIRTAGIGESFLAEKIAGWEKGLPSHIRLAYLPSLGMVKLRLTATGTDRAALEADNEKQVVALLPLIDEYVYSLEDKTLEVVIGDMLKDRKQTLSVAESCTGGYLSHLITSVPGSSEYFLGSMIPYAYEIKMRQLGVRPETLEKFGAVSEETITEMAAMVRARFSTDVGVATSGIAGPGGATPEKPVGTVWIAYSDKYKTVTRKLQLSNNRMLNIQMASVAVLNLIRKNLPPLS
ncbi:MAG: competence/damage-inducible protein A [Bacteroidota bacterium]